MVRPVSDEFEVSQEFGSFPTAGVTANPNGSTVQRLVFQYGNYQPFGHAGQDIACPIGTPVRAIADGVVVWADWGTNLPGDDTDAGYRQRWYLYKSFPGIVTVIQHDGWLSVYGHLSNNDPAPRGTKVREGQLIAHSGNTGGVAPHLHVAAIVDTSYRTSGGLIYGCADPAPFYGSRTITAQSATITPIEQPKEWDEMASAEELESIVRRVVWGGPNGTMIHNYRLGRGEYAETILGALEGRMQNEILPAVVVGPLQQQLGGLAAKVDALATALAAKPDSPLTKEEALAQLDASVKASFGEYTPVLVKTDTVPEGAPSNG